METGGSHESAITPVSETPSISIDSIRTLSTSIAVGLLGLRRVLSSGAKLSSELHASCREKFTNAEICEFYGASELSFVAIAKSSEAIPNGSVGRAFAGVEIAIRDEQGRSLPPGQVGRIFVMSAMHFLGYTQDYGDALVKAGAWLSVGDLGYLNENGCLFLAGRSDRMIVSAGKNIYPEEVESALLEHVAVDAAAVIAVADEKRGKRLVGVIRCKPTCSVSRSALVQHGRQYLPQYKVPQIFFICENWPQTRSGKTDYAAINKAFQAGEITPLT